MIEASGRLEAATGCFELVRRGGTVLLFGVYPQGQTIPISAFQINEDELRVVGSLNNPSTHSSGHRSHVVGPADGPMTWSATGWPSHELAMAMDLDNFA